MRNDKNKNTVQGCWNNPYSIGGRDDDLTLQLVVGSSRVWGTQ
jgi:hypothetical protein